MTVGKGKFHPKDTEEFAVITIEVDDEGMTVQADFETNDETVGKCAEALCGLLCGFPAVDILQINNKAVYYNIDFELPLDRLFCATIAVNAAKTAAVDYMKKKNIPMPKDALCKCFIQEDENS